MIAQFLSVLIVDTVLNYKAEKLIRKNEDFKMDHRRYPKNLSEISNSYNFGIEYTLYRNTEYELEYSRGFLVREIYSSTSKDWESFGWND